MAKKLRKDSRVVEGWTGIENSSIGVRFEGVKDPGRLEQHICSWASNELTVTRKKYDPQSKTLSVGITGPREVIMQAIDNRGSKYNSRYQIIS